MVSISDRVSFITDEQEAVEYFTTNAPNILRVRVPPHGVSLANPAFEGEPDFNNPAHWVGALVERTPVSPNGSVVGVALSREVAEYLQSTGIYDRFGITVQRLVLPS